MNISIRDVDDQLFNDFKAMAAKKGLNMSEAFKIAVSRWMTSEKTKKKLNFLDFEPWDWGPGNEKASMEIDETLYGGSKPA